MSAAARMATRRQHRRRRPHVHRLHHATAHSGAHEHDDLCERDDAHCCRRLHKLPHKRFCSRHCATAHDNTCDDGKRRLRGGAPGPVTNAWTSPRHQCPNRRFRFRHCAAAHRSAFQLSAQKTPGRETPPTPAPTPPRVPPPLPPRRHAPRRTGRLSAQHTQLSVWPPRPARTDPPPTIAWLAPADTSAVATAPNRGATCARMLAVSAPTFTLALGTAPPRRATCPTMLVAARAAARTAVAVRTGTHTAVQGKLVGAHVGAWGGARVRARRHGRDGRDALDWVAVAWFMTGRGEARRGCGSSVGTTSPFLKVATATNWLSTNPCVVGTRRHVRCLQGPPHRVTRTKM